MLVGIIYLVPASTAAAIAVKEWLEANNKKRAHSFFYGCPAEEGGFWKSVYGEGGIV